MSSISKEALAAASAVSVMLHFYVVRLFQSLDVSIFLQEAHSLSTIVRPSDVVYAKTLSKSETISVYIPTIS